jgi:chemotaxis protein CheC
MDRQDSLILFLHIRFEITQKEIGGYVALMMDIPSMDHLRALIADYVNHVTVQGQIEPDR